MTDKPNEDDLRHDDVEYNPAVEPKLATAWLNLLEESEEAFESWNTHCDRIDKQYASLERLANMTRDKEFQMFWANCEVLKPSIYAKAPVPVVVPKFKDRRPIYQEASEVMERCATVAFDLTYINDLMLQVRDDVAMIGRGVPWCRFESVKEARNSYGYGSRERVCIDFKHRRDFLHSVSRAWTEVTWVAGASYLTRVEARERFHESSGDEYQNAEYRVDKDTQSIGGADNRERAKFWEIWSKGDRRVVWVAKGCERILDEADPHLELQGFFPCPKPAYGALQRGSLVPVPDVMQYRDQLEEVNLLTGRIHALSDALAVKGFYPAGGGEIADAVATALKIKSPSEVLVPIKNWAAFGGSKEVIIWLPLEMIATTITALVTLRKQVIEDIYQIMGLSDIMRGATDARETLGAQQLKTEYGSSRIRDKQYELIRIARDLVVIVCEIICQKYKDATIIEMSQTQLPTANMQQQAVQRIIQQAQAQAQQIQQAAKSPQVLQMMQQNPQQAQQLAQQGQQALQQIQQQAQEQIQQIASQPNIDKVLKFMRDNRARVFVLDIETDSTIMADENTEKQRRTEFMQVLGSLLPQLAQMMAAEPQSAEFCGELLKFATAPFRAGRSLDGTIDELVEQMKKRADGPRPDDPTTATNKTALQIEQLKQNRQAERDKADISLKERELKMKDDHERMKIQSNENIKMLEIKQKQQDDIAKAQQTNQKAMYDREKHQFDILEKQDDMRLNQQKMAMAKQAQNAKQADMQARQNERQAAQAFKEQEKGLPPFGGV